MSIEARRAARDVVRLSTIVQAYARRKNALAEYQIAITADDRSDIVGMDEARAVRRRITEAIAEKVDADGHLEKMLELAYEQALAREDADS